MFVLVFLHQKMGHFFCQIDIIICYYIIFELLLLHRDSYKDMFCKNYFADIAFHLIKIAFVT